MSGGAGNKRPRSQQYYFEVAATATRVVHLLTSVILVNFFFYSFPLLRRLLLCAKLFIALFYTDTKCPSSYFLRRLLLFLFLLYLATAACDSSSSCFDQLPIFDSLYSYPSRPKYSSTFGSSFSLLSGLNNSKTLVFIYLFIYQFTLHFPPDKAAKRSLALPGFFRYQLTFDLIIINSFTFFVLAENFFNSIPKLNNEIQLYCNLQLMHGS